MKPALITSMMLFVVLLSACSPPEGPEQAIRTSIDELETALAERSPGTIMDTLAESFLGGRDGELNLDREGAKKMLGVYFLRYHRIRVVVSQVEVTLDPYEPALAQARATVALAGGERLLPNSAGVYQVESHWRKFDGEWQITRLQWR